MFEFGILALAFVIIVGAVVVFYFAARFAAVANERAIKSAEDSNKQTLEALKKFADTITTVSHPWFTGNFNEQTPIKPREDREEKVDLADLSDEDFRSLVIEKKASVDV